MRLQVGKNILRQIKPLGRQQQQPWRSKMVRCFSSSSSDRTLEDLHNEFRKEIAALPEIAAMENFEAFLIEKSHASNQNLERWKHIAPPRPPPEGYTHVMAADDILLTLDAAMATFALHVESRIAALVGKGFYTIGPCGEEMLSAIGTSLEDYDDAALHYRHLGVSLARQLKRKGRSETVLRQLLLDRARGYTVSKLDPVTGGVHCSIGSHEGPGRDYLVTSTLASQCPSAVGRALGYSVAAQQKVSTKKDDKQKPISFVSVGDGSVHNHHFWSAFHLARHARHLNIQCPVVYGISNNGISISYETKDYVNTLFDHDPLIRSFHADGGDMMNVYDQTQQATKYARQRSAPTVLLYQNITRRFGHAASDRQHAYLSAGQIQAMADSSVLERAIAQAVEVFNVCTYNEVKDRFAEIRTGTRQAFNQASTEAKVTREDMLEIVSQPMIACPRLPASVVEKSGGNAITKETKTFSTSQKLEVMRKAMTRVLEESLENEPSVVYIGEDVEHGGYYLVTDQVGQANQLQS